MTGVQTCALPIYIYKAAEGSHLLILGVNHNEFAQIDFKRLKNTMAQPNILDTRNFWDKTAVAAAGLKYYLLGDGSGAQV